MKGYQCVFYMKGRGTLMKVICCAICCVGERRETALWKGPQSSSLRASVGPHFVQQTSHHQRNNQGSQIQNGRPSRLWRIMEKLQALLSNCDHETCFNRLSSLIFKAFVECGGAQGHRQLKRHNDVEAYEKCREPERVYHPQLRGSQVRTI